MRHWIPLLIIASGLVGPLSAQPNRDGSRLAIVEPEWDGMQREAVQLLAEYLRVNTINPPGNELAGIRFLRELLAREGIEALVLDTAELGPGRANLYARLRGNGSKRAIALIHHVDLAPADPRYWSVPPLGGEIKDGYLYGRGALDMKGQGIVHLMAMIALKRAGIPLTRDIVFIANADEELGSAGARVFVERHRDLLRDVEFLLTEQGRGNSVVDGRLRYYGVGVAEKRPFWQRITVRGIPSHGSRPTKDNPVPRLAAAVDKLARYETPLRLTPGVEKYFADISSGYNEERRAWLKDLRKSINDSLARAWILSDVQWNAMLRNTITPTVLVGSNKTNVIPAEAYAEFDIRLLPGEDSEEFLATLKRVVNDSLVTWVTLSPPRPPLDNPIDTDLFRAIERAAQDREPGATVTTPLTVGYTDRPIYRAAGIVAYGFDPFKVEEADYQRGVHGNDERVSVQNVGFGIRFLYDVLRYLQ